MDEPLPDRVRKGRGAVSNRAGRFEPHQRHAVDDGWDIRTEDELAPPVPTVLLVDSARTAITRNESPDVPFDRSVNPYRGCEHGCVYCFARPSHAYLGLSPGLDFETRLFHKPEIAALLEQELRRPSYRPAPLALGANTDPYQPVERRLELTRSILKVLAAFSHPVTVVTKSALVLRDLDLLVPMAAQRLASVCVSVTTLDPVLARTLEPRAATPARRLETIRRLARAGVPVTVLASPMIPGLNDHELERILQAAAEAGASGAATILIRLAGELKDLFTEWLEAHVPDRAGRVLSLIRQCHGGALYESAFGRRMTGQGPYAALIESRFAAASQRCGLDQRRRGHDLDSSRFIPPPMAGDQLSLF